MTQAAQADPFAHFDVMGPDQHPVPVSTLTPPATDPFAQFDAAPPPQAAEKDPFAAFDVHQSWGHALANTAANAVVGETGTAIAGTGRAVDQVLLDDAKRQLANVNAHTWFPETRAKAKAALEAQIAELEKPQPGALERAGTAVDQFSQQQFPVDPTKEGRATGVVRTIAGLAPVLVSSAAGTAIAGPLGGIAGIAGLDPVLVSSAAGTAIAKALGGIAGAAAVIYPQTYESTYQEAKQKHATEEQAHNAASENALAQTAINSVPVGRLLHNVPSFMKDGVVKTLSNLGMHGIEFGSVSAAGKFVDNYITQQTVDPKQPLTEGVFDAGLEGTIAGMVVPVGAAGARYARNRLFSSKDAAPSPPPSTTQPTSTAPSGVTPSSQPLPGASSGAKPAEVGAAPVSTPPPPPSAGPPGRTPKQRAPQNTTEQIAALTADAEKDIASRPAPVVPSVESVLPPIAQPAPQAPEPTAPLPAHSHAPPPVAPAVSPTTPEPPRDVHAQIAAVADPNNPKDAAFFAAGTPVPPGSPKGVIRVERPEGVLFTNNPDKAKFFANEVALTDAHMASLLGYPETKEQAAASGNAVVVQATDKSGAVVVDMLASPHGVPAAEQVAEAQKPPGGDVRVMTPEEGQQSRVDAFQPTAVSFTTAKGSTYQVHDDGTTTRNKAYRHEHGPFEQGPQPRSDATFYVTPDQANLLSEIQAIGGPKRAIAQFKDGYWGIKTLDGPTPGMFIPRTMILPSTEPSVGAMPVELWKNGRGVHFGNPITEVRDANGNPLPNPPIAPEIKNTEIAHKIVSNAITKRISQQEAANQLALMLQNKQLPEWFIHSQLINAKILPVGEIWQNAQENARRAIEATAPQPTTDLSKSGADLANSPEQSRPSAILAELDARGAPDAEYRSAFSTGSKEPLKRGETWRDRLVSWVTQEEGKAPEPTGAFWWDKHLTDTGRDLVMKAAGLNRSKKIKWQYLNATERGKLEAARGAAEEKIAPAPKPVEPTPAGDKQIDTNINGHPLFEDAHGVRSYVDGGARITEPVEIRPTRTEDGRIIYQPVVNRGERPTEFLTAAERDTEQPASKVAPTAEHPPPSQSAAAPTSKLKAPVDEWAQEVADAFRRGGAQEAAAVFKRIHDERKPTNAVSAVFRDKAQKAMREAGWTGGKDEGPPPKAPEEIATQPPPAAEPAPKAQEPAVAVPQAAKPVTEPTAPPTTGPRLVSNERAAELKARLQAKLRGQLNSGIDPETMAIGAELAVHYIESGFRSFVSLAGKIADELGTTVGRLRPFLRSWYNGARDMMEDHGIDVSGMDAPEAVKAHLERIDQETNRELERVDQSGAKPLAPVSTDEVPPTPGGGETGPGPASGSGENAPGNAGVGGERIPVPRGVGDGEGTLPVSSGGETDEGRGQRGEQGSDGNDGGLESLAAATGQNGKRRVAPRNRPASGTAAGARGDDFAHTDQDEIGKGGAKTKYRANVDAIRILRALDAENRPATREEQAALSKWVGWGGLPMAFERSDGGASDGWAKEVAELKELLTPDEYQEAAASSRNAHYTSPEVVKGMWAAMQRMGFNGGRLLEPSVGIGNFFGLMPRGLRTATALHGVERDTITSGLAKYLYPQAKIARMPFQQYLFPDGHFDAVVGNPPFGSETLHDPNRRDLAKFSIHNYFFARSIDGLKPGGVMAMVVTNRFLDGNRDMARQYIADRADLVGAIRLPNDAFKKNAGTEVTTDVLFFRKRLPGEPPSGVKWMETKPYTDRNGETVPLNQYFHDHPEMLLGEYGAFGKMYAGKSGIDKAALIPREGQDTPKLLNEAIERLPKDIASPMQAPEPEEAILPGRDITHVRIGSMFVDGDKIMVRAPDVMGEQRARPVEMAGDTAEKRLRGILAVRDALTNLRVAQLDRKVDDRELAPLRKTLNVVYDRFVKDNGPINLDANKRLFREDSSWPQVSALEESFQKGITEAVAKKTGEKAAPPSARKAAIFTKRTQFPYSAPDRADTAKDALVLSLSQRGRIDLDYMRQLYRKSNDEIISELGDLVFDDPQASLVTRDEYLSGNVKLKLAQAREAAERDSRYQRNVTELEAVQPADISPELISVKPGATWLPIADMRKFAEETLNGGGRNRVEVFFNPAAAAWTIEGEASPATVGRFGVVDANGRLRADPDKVLTAAANQRPLVIYDKHTDGTRTVNAEATEIAKQKVAAATDAFGQWIWRDDDRRERLSRLYNDTFNTNIRRRFDGSHLNLVGKVADAVLKLRPTQNNAIWRIIAGQRVLLDHVVGAGKTYTMIGGAMELRRMGFSKKPMIVVPNHLVGQWAADFARMYPNASVLVASKNDFEAANRKRLFARIATGDWDAVIVPHSSLVRVEVEPQYVTRFINEQIHDLQQSMETVREQEGKGSRNVKKIQEQIEKLREKIAKLMNEGRKDNNLYWGDLGVDALFVDEAHEFKNLAYSTSMGRVAGLGTQKGSQKAFDLFVKTRHVLEATGDRNVVFATGTPISNTMAEMFTMQRYLDYKALKEQGLAHFDAWARQYGQVVTDWELSPAGKYKMNARFAKFVNLQELMQRYMSFADVINRNDINESLKGEGKVLPVPKVAGGKPQPIINERSALQAAYIGEPIKDAEGNETEEYPEGSLVYRSEHLPKGPLQKGDDNMLKIMSDARKAALDMRLIMPSAPDEPGSKVNVAAKRIKDIYDRTKADRGAQLVFCDLSTPKAARGAEAERIRDLIKKADEGDDDAQEALDKMSPDDLSALESEFSVYDDLKAKLIKSGIPASEIAFIHDANTDLRKEELFGKVRSGRVRVLVGSTGKMGAGMNVQERLVALHHLDAPWRPSDLEQREGRIIRQGNVLRDRDPENFAVDILRYATTGTLDARMWQTLESKANFIEQVRSGANSGLREAEDIGGEAANSAEMKAAASGNPLILEEMSLRKNIRNLEAERQGHQGEQYRARHMVRMLESTIKYRDEKAANISLDFDKVPTQFAVTINGQEYTKRVEAGEAITALAKQIETDDPTGKNITDVEIGNYGGFKLVLDHHVEKKGSHYFRVVLKGSEQEYSPLDAWQVGNQDPGGLAQRISNLVNNLPEQAQRTKQEADTARRNADELRKQAADWPKEAELEQARQRHADVIAALKMKKKAPSPVVSATPAAPAVDEAQPRMAEATAALPIEPPVEPDLTPKQRGVRARDETVRRIREAAGDQAGVNDAAKAFSTQGFAKNKQEAASRAFQLGAFHEAKGYPRQGGLTASTMLNDAMLSVDQVWPENKISPDDMKKLKAAYAAGVAFAKANPANVKPIAVEGVTARGQRTRYQFTNPDAARAVADRIAKMPGDVFFNRPNDGVPEAVSSPSRQAMQVLADNAQSIVGPHVRVELHDGDGLAVTYPDGRTETVDGLTIGRLIRAAMSPRPEWSLNHEAIHALRNLGVFTPAEWNTLLADARREGWINRYRIDERYPDLSPELRMEEAIADRFADQAATVPMPGTALARAWTKFHAFLARLRNALRGNGFRTADDVFNRVTAGEVGQREPGSGMTERGPRSVDASEQAASRWHQPGTEQPMMARRVALPEPVKTALEEAHRTLRERVMHGPRDVMRALFPMAHGSKEAMTSAWKFANDLRYVQLRFGTLDRQLLKEFKPAERAAMGRALDRQSVFEQNLRDDLAEMDPNDSMAKAAYEVDARANFAKMNIGIDSLTPEQQTVALALNRLSQLSWTRMQQRGMVKPDANGLPYYMPRQFVMVEDDKARRLTPQDDKSDKKSSGSGEGALTSMDKMGANLRTQGPRRRAYRTAEESDAAAKARFGDGATMVEDVRSLVHALARNERAIAGRDLIDAIQAYGSAAGRPDVVVEGRDPGPGWFTLNHPSARTWAPVLGRTADGKFGHLHDADGNPMWQKVAIHISDDFKGPLEAVLTKPTPDWYRAAMKIKGGVMRTVMYSPFIHLNTELGRAFPLMKGRTFTLGYLRDGAEGINDPDYMAWAVGRGIAPIGQGWSVDPATIMDDTLAPLRRGKIMTALVEARDAVAAKIGQKFGPAAEEIAKEPHARLLWDNIFRLQIGIMRDITARFEKKGYATDVAGTMAAHVANRYAGALPPEHLSRLANMAANLGLFSRSFTLGNLAVMKDIFTGAPPHVLAEIERLAGPEVARDAKTELKRLALSNVITDIGMSWMLNAALQTMFRVALGASMLGLVGAAKDAYEEWLKDTMEGLNDVGHGNPLGVFRVLPQMNNEPGRTDRALIGRDSSGRAYYWKSPFGRIGDEFLGWMTHPGELIKSKLSTFVKPAWETVEGEDSMGRKIYSPVRPQTLGEWIDAAGRIVGHFVEAQLPGQTIQAANDIVHGRNLRISGARVLGQFSGLGQPSQGYPTGPQGGVEHQDAQRREYARQQAVPVARQQLADGDRDGAMQTLRKWGFTDMQIAQEMKSMANPARTQQRATKTFLRNAPPDAQRERGLVSQGASLQ